MPLAAQTAHAACTLAHLGCGGDPRLAVTFQHLLATQFDGGGWRCNKFSYGRGPETDFANPRPSLIALDAFRFTDRADSSPELDRAVEFLLGHWVTRVPLGPCHYGIGTLFLQVEYPFAGYNLFYWLHVLSHYDRAASDPRFAAALAVLEANLVDGQIVPERVNRELSGLQFCMRGQPSALGTERYREVLANVAGSPSHIGPANARFCRRSRYVRRQGSALSVGDRQPRPKAPDGSSPRPPSHTQILQGWLGRRHPPSRGHGPA